jgi:hypothetical protein
MDRAEVYKLIDGEREYQDSLGPDRTDGRKQSVEGFATMLSHYQGKLVDAWVLHPGDDDALDVMRKIAAITVHCMEIHGAPPRLLFGCDKQGGKS